MRVGIDKSFDKDVSKVKNKTLLKRLAEIIEQVQEAGNKEEIRDLKKIQGYEAFYRIRLGDYRIGVEIVEKHQEEGVVYFVRFLHRKDIYRYFP